MRIPEVGEYIRNIGVLVKVETIQPPIPDPYKEYIFEDIESRCELKLGGELIKELGTLCDFYGIGTGTATAIKEAKEYAKDHNLSKTSELEVVVVKVTQQRKYKPLDREAFYAKGFYDFASTTRQYDLPEPKEEIVWSSKNLETP